MKVQGDISPIILITVRKWTLITFNDQCWRSSYFFLYFLVIYLRPLLFYFLALNKAYFKLIYFFCEHFVGNRILFNFGYHNLINEINFPKLLIIAHFFIIFRIDWIMKRLLNSVDGCFFMAISSATHRS